MAQHAAGVEDVGDVTVLLFGLRGHQRRRSAADDVVGPWRSSRRAPIEYVRMGPTPWVSTSQPSAVSIGGPQLPTCTGSQGAMGASSGLTDDH